MVRQAPDDNHLKLTIRRVSIEKARPNGFKPAAL
jgi:hypothetical protein